MSWNTSAPFRCPPPGDFSPGIESPPCNKIAPAHVTESPHGTKSPPPFTACNVHFDAVTEESFQVVYAASHWVAAACVDEQVMIANSIGDTLSPIRNAAVAYWPSNGQSGRLRPTTQPAGLHADCLQPHSCSNGSLSLSTLRCASTLHCRKCVRTLPCA